MRLKYLVWGFLAIAPFLIAAASLPGSGNGSIAWGSITGMPEAFSDGIDNTGGTPSFDQITSGTNSIPSAMVVGAGSSLTTSGGGTITATTAAALAANPSEATCGIGKIVRSIAANGDLTCTDIVDDDIPDSITIGLASIATASFSTVQINTDPADCQIANEVALGINSFGVATCTALTDSYIPNDITINRATDATSADDLTCTNCIGPTEISDLTLSTDTAGNFVAAITTSSPLSGGGVGAEDQTYTLGVTDGAVTGDKFNANVAGGYLTKDTAATPDELDLDTEVVTDDECSVMRISAGIVNTDDIASIFHTSIARTVTRIWCETDTGTATINLLRDDGSTASMATADLVCDTTGEDACATGCSTTVVAAEDNIAAQEEIDLSVVSVASAPTRLSFCITWTKDDI